MVGALFDMGGRPSLVSSLPKRNCRRSRSMPFTNPVHGAGNSQVGEPDYERRSESAERGSSKNSRARLY